MKAIALALVALLVLAFTAQRQEQSASVVTCGEVKGGQVLTDKGITWAEDFGSWLHNLAERPIGPDAVKATVKGVEKVIFYWARAWFLSSKGLRLDPEIMQVQQAAADARAAAESQCTPCPQALPQDSSPLAALGATTVTGSPEDVARQVAARYWPADQVDTAVAIAGAESTWNPKAHNSYGAGVEGLWQINVQAHRDLVAGKDLTDPSVNAYAAHQIWLDAGKSWTPWTTYTSGSYKKFLKPSAAAKLTAAIQPQTTSATTPDPTSAAPVNPQNVGCQSSGMPAVAVATWNMYVHNSESNVLAGMRALGKQADIIGTQENCSSSQKQAELDAMGGEFAMSAGNTCDAIFYRKAKFTLTAESSNEVFKRTDDYEGPSQGDRYINTAVLRDTLTGQTITEVNWHQIPQVQKNGKLNMAWPKRVQASRNIVGAAMTSVRTHMAQGAVISTADSNYSGDPDGAYRAAGLTQASSVFGDLKQATRTRDIDQILFSAGSPTSEKVLPANGSDHSPRVVTFPGSTDTAAAETSAPTPADFNFAGQNTVDQAIAFMQAQGSATQWGGRCLAVVARAYGQSSTQPFGGHYYAIAQFENMPARYKHTDGSTPPRGALVFWHTGNVAGHIAISDGNGYVWSSDPPGGRHGSVARVKIDSIDAWGPRAGWSAPYFPGRTGGSAT